MQTVIDIETTPDMRPGARESFIEDARNNVKAPSDMSKEKALDELGILDANERKFTSKDKVLSLWCERFGLEKAEEIGDANWRKTSFDATQGKSAASAMRSMTASPIPALAMRRTFCKTSSRRWFRSLTPAAARCSSVITTLRLICPSSSAAP